MSIFNAFVAYKFLKILSMPFEKTDAYKEGVIDKKGNQITPRKEFNHSQQMAYTIFHHLIFKLKKIMNKVPVLKSRIGSFAAALWFIKETIKEEYDETQAQLIEETFISYLTEQGYDVKSMMVNESFSSSTVIEPGIYIYNNKEYNIARSLYSFDNCLNIPLFKLDENTIIAEVDIKMKKFKEFKEEIAANNAGGGNVAGLGSEPPVSKKNQKIHRRRTAGVTADNAKKESVDELDEVTVRHHNKPKWLKKAQRQKLGLGGRQLKDPKKEVMVVDKKGKVIVIDRKDLKSYERKSWDIAESVLNEADNTAAIAKQVKQAVKKYTTGKLVVRSKGGKSRFIMVRADKIDNKLRKMILDIEAPTANVRDKNDISYGNISDRIISASVNVWVKALGLKETKRFDESTDKFAGSMVFNVTPEEYNKCFHGRSKNERWKRKLNMDEMERCDIRTYHHKNPGKSIIVQNERTGEMTYLVKAETSCT